MKSEFFRPKSSSSTRPHQTMRRMPQKSKKPTVSASWRWSARLWPHTGRHIELDLAVAAQHLEFRGNTRLQARHIAQSLGHIADGFARHLSKHIPRFDA